MVALSSAWTSLLYTVSFVWLTVQVNEQYDTENTTNTPLQYTQQPVKKHAPELEIPTVLEIKKKVKKKTFPCEPRKQCSIPLSLRRGVLPPTYWQTSCSTWNYCSFKKHLHHSNCTLHFFSVDVWELAGRSEKQRLIRTTVRHCTVISWMVVKTKQMQIYLMEAKTWQMGVVMPYSQQDFFLNQIKN